jgi:hypothetical protein
MTGRFAVPIAMLCAGLALGDGAALSAQGQAPVRDRASVAPVAGTASLSGTVVDGNGKPLRHAVVTLNGQTMHIGRTTITDDTGRFVFVDLPAGRFSLEATKGGYLAAYYRGKRPGRPPAVPIPIADGQHLADVSLTMWRGGVVSGRVTDDNGRPMFVAVQAMQVQMVNGRRTISPQFTAFGYADERGIYRIFGLVPGEYVVSAAPPRLGGATPEVRMVSAAALQGAEIAVREARAGAPAAASSPAAPKAASKTETRTAGYATVYFPGTTDLAAASTVSIAPGTERTDIDLRLTMEPMSTLAGTVLGAGGQPAAGVTMNLVSSGPTGGRIQSATTERDGSFSISSVAPGEYTLMARLVTPASTTWALMDLAADGRDRSDLSLMLQPGLTVSGHIQLESTSGTPPAFSAMKVQLDAERPENGAIFGVAPVQPDATGAFTFAGVPPGWYRMSVSLPPTGAENWTLKTAAIDGAAASDVPVSIRRDTDAATVTLTDQRAGLTGVLQDANGTPSPEYSLVVFSADRRFWLPKSRRRVGPIRPGADGRFVVADLPPGEYFLAAVIDLDASELEDNALLEQLAAAAVKVTLIEGQQVTQNIKVGGQQVISRSKNSDIILS